MKYLIFLLMIACGKDNEEDKKFLNSFYNRPSLTPWKSYQGARLKIDQEDYLSLRIKNPKATGQRAILSNPQRISYVSPWIQADQSEHSRYSLSDYQVQFDTTGCQYRPINIIKANQSSPMTYENLASFMYVRLDQNEKLTFPLKDFNKKFGLSKFSEQIVLRLEKIRQAYRASTLEIFFKEKTRSLTSNVEGSMRISHQFQFESGKGQDFETSAPCQDLKNFLNYNMVSIFSSRKESEFHYQPKFHEAARQRSPKYGFTGAFLSVGQLQADFSSGFDQVRKNLTSFEVKESAMAELHLAWKPMLDLSLID